MKTHHKIYFKNSIEMRELPSSSISLIITSPPYPMIEMWDALFSSMNSEIKEALEQKEGKTAF
ncbi:MAG: site-specific DNA-methyltransferase, partial [Promethearchaeota archaeon]